MDFSIKRLDHLGIVAGIMRDLKLIETTDKLLNASSQNNVTPGEAVAAMILNGLGFTSRPTTLTPQFFNTKPLDILIRSGLSEDDLNRHKLGRVLDSIAAYGCEKFFNTTALQICKDEKIDISKIHGDTTTFEVEGDYKNQEEQATVKITHGYSKAKRPDLKQIVFELCVSADGGVPFVLRPWSGNKADNAIFNERVKALQQAAAASSTGITYVGDSKLYTSDNIKALGKLYFISRVPASIAIEGLYIDKSIACGEWIMINEKYKYQSFDLEHYGIQQRWIVHHSVEAEARAKETVAKKLLKDEEQLKKDLKHLQNDKFACAKDANSALDAIKKKYKYHGIVSASITSVEKYDTRGRPTDQSKLIFSHCSITATYKVIEKVVAHDIEHRSCFVLATNIPEAQLASGDVKHQYKDQDFAEKGFAFLKTPEFFTDAFYIKSVDRIQAMLVIMTLALLIYTVAQRRMRRYLDDAKKTIPNQINKETKRPTLRWLFQCLEGINVLRVIAATGHIETIITDLTDLRITILSCFGESIMKIYRINREDVVASG